jgi:hypothetical protein
MLAQWPSGYRHMVTPAMSMTWMQKSVAPTRWRSRISQQAAAILFVARTLSWCHSRKFVTRTASTTQTLPAEMQTTATLKQVLCGTELSIMQEGLPEVIPPEMCYLGWQESLAQLAHLVEPEIPD